MDNIFKDLISPFFNKNINNKEVLNLFYNIGLYIKDYDNKKILDMEIYIQKYIGTNIVFSRRNLKNMVEFNIKHNLDAIDYNLPWISYVKNKTTNITNDYTLIELKKIQTKLKK